MKFLTSDLGLRSKVISPNESPCVISYRCTIQMKSLSLIVFEIFAKMTFWVIDLGPRSKVISPNESPYMISYMSTIQMESLALVVCMLFEETCLFDLSRSSEVKGHGRISTKKLTISSLCHKQLMYIIS